MTLLRYGLRNCKTSILYWKLDVVMIPFSCQQPCQIHFLIKKIVDRNTDSALLSQQLDVFRLIWSGFESHKWLMNPIKTKNEIDFEFGSDFHNQMWFHKNSFFHLFRCRHVPRQKSAFYLVIWFNSWPPHVQIISRFSQVKYKFYFPHAFWPSLPLMKSYPFKSIPIGKLAQSVSKKLRKREVSKRTI